MTHASFKKQGLKVDWIGLNCEKLQELDLKKVAKVLCELGFNSILAEKIDQKTKNFGLGPRSILPVKTQITFTYTLTEKEASSGLRYRLLQT
jgi:hypothetical protein